MSVLERLKDRMYRLETTTQTVYLNAMKQLVEFAGEKEVYDVDDVTGFLAQKSREGRKKTTRNNYYYHFKVIWEIMDWEWAFTPKARPSKNKPYRPFYNLKEMEALMEAAEKAVKTKGRYGEFLKLRNKLLIRFDAGTVLRVGEIARLDVENYRRPYLYVMNPEKDSEHTQRLLDAETCALMDQYLKARRRYKSPALFITKTGKKASRISTRALSHVLLGIRKAAGIYKPRGGWHAFRRGGMTLVHKRTGMSSKAISKVVGITEKMVDRYIQLDTTDAIEMWAESHPFYDKAATVAAEVRTDEGVPEPESVPEPEETVERIGAALGPRYIRDPETGGLRRVSQN